MQNRRSMNLVAAALLVGSIIVLAVLRLTYVPPSYFFEGDDAALATGVARMCEKDEIGPYFMQPPPVQVTEGSAATGGVTVQDALASMPARYRYYRYSSMPGMYLLGKLTCSLGEAATRLSWISFIAGTVYPLLLALFLIRLFGPFPGIALPICYIFIAISPELWVSGSAYSNDKIVAICFLVGALLVSLYSARDDEKQQLALIALSGGLFGLAILMRLDTVLFLPAALLVVIGTGRTLESISSSRLARKWFSRVSSGNRGRLGGAIQLRTLYSLTLSAVFLSATGIRVCRWHETRRGLLIQRHVFGSDILQNLTCHLEKRSFYSPQLDGLKRSSSWSLPRLSQAWAFIRLTRGRNSSLHRPSRWKFCAGRTSYLPACCPRSSTCS